jgi:transcriptional regulator with XRE-family HTH domain
MNEVDLVNTINWIRARLRARRLGLGMNRTQLAEKTGISKQMIQYTEDGTRTPSLETLVRLMFALDLTIELPADESH